MRRRWFSVLRNPKALRPWCLASRLYPSDRALEWPVTSPASIAGHHASMVAASRCTSGLSVAAARSRNRHSRWEIADRSGTDVPGVGARASRSRSASFDGVGVEDLDAEVAGVDQPVPQPGERDR